MSQESRWRLQSIKIRSFRGVADEQIFEFAGKPGLLHGNNGVGKSTVAQCFQWTIYGKFPSEVLLNVGQKGFLSPVGGKTDAWFGQTTLQSGNREMIITRDQATKQFSVEVDGETYTDAEAEELRDRLIGLDMAGFVRTVLLQQSRIRGLLLDSPKERNEALDRLLGMDDIEKIFARLNPKEFVKVAEARRENIRSDQNRHEAQEQLLVDKRDEAQRQARAYEFQNKDFNNVGLERAYAAIGEKLLTLAAKYKVDIEPLAPCTSMKDAPALAEQLASALRALRTESKLSVQLAEIDKTMSGRAGLKASTETAFADREKIQEQRNTWVRARGEHKAVMQHCRETEGDLNTARSTLKAAGELRQLLADAKAHVEHSPTDSCPVCQQSISSVADLISGLSARLDALSSDEIADLEAHVTKAEDDLAAIDTALKEFDDQEASLQKSQKSIDGLRAEAIQALDGKGISESKISARLDEAIRKLKSRHDDLALGAAAMEDDLAGVEKDDRRVRDGLLPVLESRATLAKLEDDWTKTQKGHGAAEAAAAELESISDQLTRLRAALLDAKNELATNTLSEASPRANELYKLLVRHPVFDALTITTAPKANKIDYSFEVTSAGRKGTAREARLVLSDGQVTATAIGLFFALSDAETHNLDLLYVDDPTQNLDLPCKEAMAKVVTEMAERRQVVVSTQDEDFVSFLEAEGFFDVAVVHHFESWDGNPTVMTKMAG